MTDPTKAKRDFYQAVREHAPAVPLGTWLLYTARVLYAPDGSVIVGYESLTVDHRKP